MIRITALEDTLDNEGGVVLSITGHGDDRACARVSAVWNTMLLGFAAMAKTYPKQVRFQKIETKKAARRG